MKLNLSERFALQKLLFKIEGDFLTIKIINQLRLDLAPSEEEIKEFEIQSEDGKIFWNEKGIEEKEIPIGEKADKIIKEALEILDRSKKLTSGYLNIYEKFIINKE